MRGSSNGFGGDVELGAVGMRAEMEAMLAHDETKGKHVEDEEEGTEHRALGDARRDWGCQRWIY